MKKQQNRSNKSTKQNEAKFFLEDVKGDSIIVRRKLTYVDTDAAVTGATLSYAVLSSGACVSTEWANLSANYEEFRVRAVKLRLIARIRDNTDIGAGLFYPGTLISNAYPAGSGASTALAAFAADGSRLHPEWTLAEHVGTWSTNPNAKLWSACNTNTVVSGYAFGVQCRGTSSASAALNGLVTHDVFIEYDVEFRGRN